MRMRLAFLLYLCGLSSVIYGQQLTCDDGFNLVGSATQEDECFVLTQNASNQGGCAWFLEPLDFTMPFTISVSCSFGTNDAGADGICLVFQTESDASCGGTGIDIGAGGISNSFIIEADTWDNGAVNGDIPSDHLAININGDMQSPIDGPVDLGNIEDGGDYNIDFSWDPATMTYDVSVAGGSLSGTFDIINNCFNGETMAWWGFTSSTGGATNRHTVCPGLPPEVTADAVGNLPTYVLPCADATLQLDGTNSDQGGDFIYEWSTFDGNIIDGAFSLTPTVDQAGTYMLTVTNTVTNCTDESEVIITEEELIANIFAPDDLDCDLDPVTIYATGSSSGANITYTWDTFDGNIVTDMGSSIEVDAGGTYILTVTYDDGIFFCDEQTQVTIAAPENPPIAIASDAVLYCDPATVQLDGTGSSDAGFYGYEWFSSEGNVVADGNTLYPTVDEPGFYTLRVTNLNSFCFEEVEILVNDGRIPPHAEAVVDDMLSCSMSSVVIDGSLSDGGSDILYEWTTTNGNIITSPFEASPSVDAPGTYTLTVTNTATGCTAETSVEVRRDNSVVSASIESPPQFTCNTNSLTLDGSGSSVGPDITYSWSTVDGQLIGPTDDFVAEAGLPGTYTLTVTHTTLGCTEMSTVTVVPNDTPPTAEAGSNAVFNCGDASLTLNGSASGSPNLSYAWSTTNGSIISGANTLMPAVGSTGTYTLTVTNDDNGCIATDEVMVMGNADTPVAQAMANNVIDCNISSAVVTGNGSSTGPNITYQWTTSDGAIQGGTSGLSVIATAAGTYELQVTNSASGCSSTATAIVLIDTIPPTADAGTADIFRCGDSSLQLSGTANGPRPDLTYTWSTTDGNITGGANTLMPTVGGAGTYTLTVRDTLNGCTASDLVRVDADVNIPNVSITVNDTLDCVTNSLQLDGSNSDNGPNYMINWTTNNGQFVSGQNGLQPIIDVGGIYILTITNTDNNCMNSASVSILPDTLAPPAEIALADTINCSRDTVDLLALQADLEQYNYQWTTTNGQLSGISTDTLAYALSGGTYHLRVSNPRNACMSTDSMVVVQDTLTPQLSIAAPSILTCTQTSVDLRSSGQNLPPSIVYEWSTPDGTLTGATDTDQTSATAAGTYQLIATNPLNTCADTASVIVDISDDLPTADAGTDQTLNCDLTTTTLGGNNTSSGPTITYQWSRIEGGSLPDDDLPNLSIMQAGTYVLAVTDDANDCTQRDTVSIDANFIAPQASIAPPTIITCTDTLASLDGSNSAGQGSLSYTWFSATGSFAGTTDTSLAEASQAGSYFLEVIDSSNGCRDTAAVSVTQDDDFPQASIATPAVINCNTPSIDLTATIGGGGNLNFSWQTTDGNFLSPTDQLQIQIDAPGEYRLLVEDLDNNCRTQARVNVQQDTLAPIALAGMPTTLTCSQASLALDGNASGATNVSYRWMGPALTMPATIPNPTIDLGGRYLLEVTNTENGCRDTSSVLINEDFLAPNLQLALPDTLTCTRTEVLLDASSSTQGSTIHFLWDGPEPMLPDQAQQTVQTPGRYTLILEDSANGCRDTSSVEVTIDRALPTVQASTMELITCAQATVNLQSTGSDTGSNYNYTWRNPLAQAIGNGTEATAAMGGPFTLQITNTTNGCTDSSQVIVMVDTLSPTLSALPVTELNCIQVSNILAVDVVDAGSQATYAWSTFDGNILSPPDREAIEVNQAGAYQLIVTNPDNSCTASILIPVTADVSPPDVSLNPVTPLTCADQDEFLQLRASETITSYQWTASSGGQITSDPSGPTLLVNTPGTYTIAVVAEDNGCSTSLSVDLLQDTLAPQVTIEPASSLDCELTSTTLVATTTNGGDLYSWSTTDGQIDAGTNSLQATVSQGGTYELLVLNSTNGCSNSATVVVTQDEDLPEVRIATPGLLSCVVNSLELDATQSTPNLNYQWTTPNGQIISGADGLTPLIDQIGTYQLEVTNPDNNCQASASIQVQADRTPPVADAGEDFELSCDQSATQLDGSASAQGSHITYLWTGLSGEPIDDPSAQAPGISQTGTYQLLVTNTINGCTATDQIAVSQDLPIATSNVVAPICTGDFGAIIVEQVTGGVPPYLYAIDGQNLSATSQFTNLAPGDYQLLVEDAAGCIYSEELTLTPPDSFALSFVRDEWTINWGDSVQLELASTAPIDSSYQINWLETEWLSCTDCLDPVARPLRTFNYGVVVITPAGCRDDAYVRIYVEPNRPIYFPNAFSPNGEGDNERFYPFSKIGAVTNIPSFRIYDRWGNAVFERTDIQPNDPLSGWDGTHRGQFLNPGVFVYVAEILFSDGTTEIISGDITLLR